MRGTDYFTLIVASSLSRAMVGCCREMGGNISTNEQPEQAGAPSFSDNSNFTQLET